MEKMRLSVPGINILLTTIFSVPRIMPSLHLTPTMVLKIRLTNFFLQIILNNENEMSGTLKIQQLFLRTRFRRFFPLEKEMSIHNQTIKERVI